MARKRCKTEEIIGYLRTIEIETGRGLGLAEWRKEENPMSTNCTMRLNIILRQSANVQSARVENETVLLDVSTGRYYTLNPLGSAIWEHCTGHNTVSDIHTLLCDRFEVASERALDDLLDFLNHMVQEGLLLQDRT